MSKVKIILDESLKELGKREGFEPLPAYATPGSAAVDLRANIERPVTLRPGQVEAIPTGIKLDMGGLPGTCALVLPRSGMGKKGLVLANTIGLIDNDYQGEVIVMAMNRNPSAIKSGMGIATGEPLHIEPGMRLAQLMFTSFVQVEFEQVKSFSTKTKRGEGGFGSTGA